MRIELLVSYFFAAILVVAAQKHNSTELSYQNIAPIEITGNQFYYKGTRSRFFLKGIAYQQVRHPNDFVDPMLETKSYIDPLANPTSCLRDLELLEELGVNLIRVYQIDPTADHDICMSAYASKGIYVLADLAEPNLSINREDPRWNTELLDRYTSVVDSLHKYNNVLGFFAGNEVTTSRYNTNASPFVKAAIRDTKIYIKSMGYRQIPVGYATNDDAEIRLSLSNYFMCELNEGEGSRADFFGLNMYEWCGYSTFATSGYRERTIEYSNFPVPIFFSEYGCNTVTPRPFTEVEVLYGSAMTNVWSGGIAYLYFEGVNRYGVVEINSKQEVIKLQDFDTLLKRLNGVQPFDIGAGVAANSLQPKIVCPLNNKIWKASTKLPNSPDSGKCECIQATFACILSPYMQSETDYRQLLNEVCSEIDCSEIQVDAERGEYGRLSDCSLKQQLSYALNEYYISLGESAESCDFSGQAILVKNNNELSEIYSQDGRTCNECIGGLMNRTTVNQELGRVNPTVIDLSKLGNSTNMGLNKESQQLPYFQHSKIKSFGIRITVKKLLMMFAAAITSAL